MSVFVNALIANARKELNCRENPPGSNRSYCVDNYNKVIHGSTNNWAWCATFISYVFDKTFKQYGLVNSFIKTASTASMLEWGNKKGIVNKTPAVGSICYSSRGEGLGHVGLVIKVSGNKFYTIDGNSDNSVRTVERNLSEKAYKFIHTESLFSGLNLALNPTISLPVVLLSAAGIYYIWKKYK